MTNRCSHEMEFKILNDNDTILYLWTDGTPVRTELFSDIDITWSKWNEREYYYDKLPACMANLSILRFITEWQKTFFAKNVDNASKQIIIVESDNIFTLSF